MNLNEIFTTTGVAQHYTSRGRPLKGWHVRRVFQLGLVAEPTLRMGRYRLISAADLPTLEGALIKLGYLTVGDHLAASTCDGTNSHASKVDSTATPVRCEQR